MTTDQTVATTADTERETRAAADLKEGDWIAPGVWLADLPTSEPVEVVGMHPQNSGEFGPCHLVVFRFPDGDLATETFTGDDDPLPLATNAELEEMETGKERAAYIAGMRKFADWFEQRPWLPVHSKARTQVNLYGDNDADRVRDLAARLDAKVEDTLDDRTCLNVQVGPFEYVVVAWHAEGRKSTEADPDHGRTTAALQPKPDTLLVAHTGRVARDELGRA